MITIPVCHCLRLVPAESFSFPCSASFSSALALAQQALALRTFKRSDCLVLREAQPFSTFNNLKHLTFLYRSSCAHFVPSICTLHRSITSCVANICFCVQHCCLASYHSHPPLQAASAPHVVLSLPSGTTLGALMDLFLCYLRTISGLTCVSPVYYASEVSIQLLLGTVVPTMYTAAASYFCQELSSFCTSSCHLVKPRA